MEITYKLKLSGSGNLPLPLEKNKSYDLALTEVDCVSKHENIDQSGGEIHTYNLKVSEMSRINIIDGREIIKVSKKGSQSQILRRKIEQLWEDHYSGDIDKEEFYKKEMTKIINQYD